MSNFTQSILYSATVLALGLIAIFTIYDVVSSRNDISNVAFIEPAAGGKGESDIGAKSMIESLVNIRKLADKDFVEVKEESIEIKNALEEAENSAIHREQIEDSTLGMDLQDYVEQLDNKENADPIVGNDVSEELVSEGTITIDNNANEIDESITPSVSEIEPAAGEPSKDIEMLDEEINGKLPEVEINKEN